jgi:hypothetical protein
MNRPGSGSVPVSDTDTAPVVFGLSDESALSPTVLAVLRHLCVGDCHTFGAVLEWCEARGDCVQAVVCPICDVRFVVDDDEMDELRRWTDAEGHALVCGVVWD